MPVDDQILKDFDKHITRVEELSTWLDKLYYDPEFSTIFNRPVLSTLITGCDFLTENLETLKKKYIARRKG
ncbi:MAG: hypothetical protein HWN68_11165 [Desulfobacterales bacterium]|nr:hypothetical protein [Desulfobacterales bacterium]